MASSSNSSPFWQSVLHAILESQRTNPTPIVESLHRPQTMVQPPSSRIQNRQLDMIQEIAYEYNRNFREYQTRIGELLQIVSTSQNQHIPIPTHRRGFMTSQTDSSFQSNIDEMSNVFMSYYVYPLNRPDPTGLNNTNNNEALLTREQIAISTQTYGFTTPTDVDAGDPSSNVCPISLEPFQLGDVVCEIRECGHKFKRPNLMHWFRRDARCPVCRYDLRDYVHENTEEYRPEYNENTHPAREEPAIVQDPSLDEILETQQGGLETESDSEEMPFTQQYSSFQQSIPSSLPQFLQTMTSNFLQQSNFDVSGFRFDNNSIEFEFPIEFDASNVDSFFQQYVNNNPFLR